MAKRYLTFSIDSELYGLDIHAVKELVTLMDYTHVPKMPIYTKGIMNLRGKVVTVVDLRLRFGMMEMAYNDRTSVIVIDLERKNINPTGLIVDKILEVMEYEEEEIDNQLSLDTIVDAEYITGIGKKNGDLTVLLDIHKIISKTKGSDLKDQQTEMEEK